MLCSRRKTLWSHRLNPTSESQIRQSPLDENRLNTKPTDLSYSYVSIYLPSVVLCLIFKFNQSKAIQQREQAEYSLKGIFKIASIYSKDIDRERKHFLWLWRRENIEWTRTNGLSNVARELWNVDDRSVPFHVFSKKRQSETDDSFHISRPTSAISFEISCLYSLRLPNAVICSRNCFRSSISSNTRRRRLVSGLWTGESRSHTFVESIQFSWGSGRAFRTLSRNFRRINTVSH